MKLVSANNSGVAERVANAILERLKTEQPAMYTEVSRQYKPIKQLAGLGDILSDFGSAFNNMLTTAGNLYVTKEQAKLAQQSAKDIAAQEIEKGKIQLAAMQTQAQTQYAQMQYAAEQQRLMQLQQDLVGSDKNKMLLLAAAGLAAVLVVSMMTKKGK